jgi:hypothetical protein
MLDRDAVDEQERLGTAAHDVIDVHRDAVPTGGAMEAGLSEQFDLRPGRIRGECERGPLEATREDLVEREKSGEASDVDDGR